MHINKMERIIGLEPTLNAWKALVLPLHHIRISPIMGFRVDTNPCVFLLDRYDEC